MKEISKKKHTNDDDVELEAPLQELVLDLLRNRVETDIGISTDFFSDDSHDFTENWTTGTTSDSFMALAYLA
jgi:hypothetical protein